MSGEGFAVLRAADGAVVLVVQARSSSPGPQPEFWMRPHDAVLARGPSDQVLLSKVPAPEVDWLMRASSVWVCEGEAAKPVRLYAVTVSQRY